MDAAKIKQAFEACLRAPYRHYEEGASFAVKRENNCVTVYFEKSNGLTDWRNNFRFSAKPYHNMPKTWYCHRGFLRVFRAMLPHLLSVFSDESVTSFVLVGYSHGAALALLSHEYILFHRPALAGRVEGYGFGCPRVISGYVPPDLRARLAGFHIIRCAGDLVTHLPPRLFGYCHPVKPIVIGETLAVSAIDAHRPESYQLALDLLLAKERREKQVTKTSG
ncbi:MAG: hypothetical protein IJW46_05345 [Clostridia bacterium]|nr:hypothetical protein [Clostridia bacterium]